MPIAWTKSGHTNIIMTNSKITSVQGNIFNGIFRYQQNSRYHFCNTGILGGFSHIVEKSRERRMYLY